MKILPSGMRISSRAAFWVLAAVALLLSHDAIFLAQIGPGEALTRALRGDGHEAWTAISVGIASLGLALALAVALRLRALRRRAGALGAPRPSTTRRGRFGASWLRLFAVVAVGFAAQENIEHLVSHGHAPGILALGGPEYPMAVPVIALITALGALMATLVVGVERGLVAAIAAALGREVARPLRDTPRPPLVVAVAGLSPLATKLAGRAPPYAFAHHA